MAGGFLLVVSGVLPSARGWAVRIMLLGLLFAAVAALVTPSTRRRLLALVSAVALRGLIAPRTLWSIPERAACASRSRA